MLDPRPEPRRRERAMRVALACPEGRKLKKLVHDQKTSLKVTSSQSTPLGLGEVTSNVV